MIKVFLGTAAIFLIINTKKFLTKHQKLFFSIFFIPFLFIGWLALSFVEGFFNFAQAQGELPDFTIESPVLTSNTVSFTIRNIGTAPAGTFTGRVQWLKEDGSAAQPSYIPLSIEGGLAAGASRAISWGPSSSFIGYFTDPPADAARLLISVDSDPSSFVELNENNNRAEVVRITSETTGEELTQIDEEIVEEEIEQELTNEPEFQPKILPGNPLYFFKNTGREIKSLFTFNVEKKAALRLQYATEKILEANKLVDQGKERAIASHLKNYEKDLGKIQNLINKVEEKNPAAAKNLSEKSLERELRHQVLLGKFESKASTNNLPGIKEARDKIVERISQAFAEIDDQNKIGKIVENSLSFDGSPFKTLRNLEVLKQVEEKVPAKAKSAIQKAQANSIKRFKSQLEALPEEHQQLFSGYIEKAGGNEVSYLKVLDNLKQEEITESVTDEMLRVKDKLVSRIENRLKDSIQKDPALAKTVLQNLAGGTVEDLRTIKTMERVINPEFKPYLDSVKKDALSGFQKNIGGISQSDQEKFSLEIKDYLTAKEPAAFKDVSLTGPDLTVHVTFPREYPKNRPVIGLLNRGNADTPALTAPVNGVRLTWFNSNNVVIKSIVRSVKSLTKCIDSSCPTSSFNSIDFRDDPEGDFPADTVRFRAEVDFAKLVKESNEDNNVEDTTDFKPDFGIGTVLLTDTPQGRKFKVTIINWGDKPSPSLSVGNGIRVSWFAIEQTKQKTDTLSASASFSMGGGSAVIPLTRALEVGGYGYFEYLDEGLGKNFPGSDFSVVAEVDFNAEVDEEREENNKIEFIHCAKIISLNCLLLGEELEDLPDLLQSEVLSEVGSGEATLRTAKHIGSGLSSMLAQKDIMQIEILEDVSQNLSPQQQKIIEKVKGSIAKGITRQLQTVSAKNKDAVLRKITDDSPQSIEVIQKTFADPKVRDTLLKKQLNVVEKKVESIKDQKKLKIFEESLKEARETKETKEIIQKFSPEIIEKIKIREAEIIKEESISAPEPTPTPIPTITPTPKETVVCAQDYTPVCGADGKTYSNKCFAEKGGMKIQYEGECKIATPIITPEPTLTPEPTPAVIYQCSDGMDNDKDGYIDLKDRGCTDSKDNDEINVSEPAPTPETALEPVLLPTVIKPTISSFVVSQTAITKGQSATLSWSVSDATSIVFSPTKETITASGKKVVTPTLTTTYTITATNSAGLVTASVTVTVK